NPLTRANSLSQGSCQTDLPPANCAATRASLLGRGSRASLRMPKTAIAWLEPQPEVLLQHPFSVVRALTPARRFAGKQEVRAGGPGVGAIAKALARNGVKVLGEARLLAQ